jgi:membrane dipeptidase
MLNISEAARRLHFQSVVVDTHVDTTQRLLDASFDLGARHADGSVDIPRMRDGGVSAIFFAIWVPGTVTGASATERAMAQIGAVHSAIAKYPNELSFAKTAADIRRARETGRIAVLMAIEGGHMINHDLNLVCQFSSLGVSYMTLTHMRTTDWCDASTDKQVHNGLSDFGREAIREMNRLGMMIDVSHVSDKAVRDALETSKAPIFASHSSCRALCDSPRNVSDELIQAIARKGGVVQISFHMGFLSRAFRDAEASPEIDRQIDAELDRRCGENMACRMLESDRIVRALVGKGKLPRVEWSEIVRHIDHAVKTAGIEHVGFGSDFDGAEMPYGMEDASRLPLLTDALLQKAYSEADVERILGGNMLRFMGEVETAANWMRGTTE